LFLFIFYIKFKSNLNQILNASEIGKQIIEHYVLDKKLSAANMWKILYIVSESLFDPGTDKYDNVKLAEIERTAEPPFLYHKKLDIFLGAKRRKEKQPGR